MKIKILAFLTLAFFVASLAHAMPPRRQLRGAADIIPEEDANWAESDGEDSDGGGGGARGARPLERVVESDEEDDYIPPRIIITPPDFDPEYEEHVQRFIAALHQHTANEAAINAPLQARLRNHYLALDTLGQGTMEPTEAAALQQAIEEGTVTPRVPLAIRGNPAQLAHLMEAVEANDLATARALLEAGVDPRIPHPQAPAGRVPLHAAWTIDMVNLLLRHGANIAQPDYDGMTPLHVAVLLFRFGVIAGDDYNAHTDIVRHLIVNGADINARNIHGHRPYDFAVPEATPREALDALNPDRRMARGDSFALELSGSSLGAIGEAIGAALSSGSLHMRRKSGPAK